LILLLFTSSYPYDAQHEETFLDPEMQYLLSGFDKVILVPKVRDGLRLSVPEDVEVDESFAIFLETVNKAKAFLKVIFSPCFYRDLLTNPLIWIKPSALMRLIMYVGGARLTQEWVEKWFARTGHDERECVFYTFWFDAAAMGIGLAKRRHPHLKIVSRAHGYDVYEDRYPVHYLPCRSQALACVDGVFTDSAAGAQYLRDRFPAHKSKIEPALMGVPDPGFLTRKSDDGVFRIVSCAIIRPVKRIDLMLEGVAEASRQRPDVRFEWHHFGNSEVKGVREQLQALANDILPENARAYLPGYPGQQELFSYYQENPVDVFVNVSVSEGTPVSVMEAVSCGIPIIATAVGGNKEIVNSQSGFLLDPNPSAQEIAQAFFLMLDHPENVNDRRAASRAVWNEKYNARRNHEKFVMSLKTIKEA
jgi:glycosyltransferase involved in cell wall biosynthesis